MVTEIKVGTKIYYLDKDEWKKIKAFRYYKEHHVHLKNGITFEEWFNKFYDESLS